ncbi:MAG: hypothetical protein EPN23_01645 [Verrucomicrobia bacterium]|nr:MAG: hypothetical protein EPN23_01645 [Verrucomicrobiota bacterium]
MQCPACEKVMLILEYQGIELDHCPACGGVWLDAGELGLLLTGRPETPAGMTLKNARAGARRCPRCPRKMDTGHFDNSTIEVDACPARHGIWLDRGELTALAQAQRGPEAEAVARHLRALFGEEQKQRSEK